MHLIYIYLSKLKILLYYLVAPYIFCTLFEKKCKQLQSQKWHRLLDNKNMAMSNSHNNLCLYYHACNLHPSTTNFHFTHTHRRPSNVIVQNENCNYFLQFFMAYFIIIVLGPWISYQLMNLMC